MKKSNLVIMLSLLSYSSLGAAAETNATATEVERKMNVIISFDVKSGNEEKFQQVLASVKESLPQVSGCHDVEIFSDESDSSKFTLVETWDSKEAHQAHISKVVESGDWAAIEALLEAQPSSSYYQRL